MTLPHVLALQRATGGHARARKPLLALPDAAIRKVSQRLDRAAGNCAFAVGEQRPDQDMGACGFSRRSARGQRAGAEIKGRISPTTSGDFDYDRYGPGARAEAVRG